MHDFHYKGSNLHCEGLSLEKLAKQYGTPLFVYSRRTLTRHFQALQNALRDVNPVICFAVKSNSNLSVLRTLANLGSGFDIVSGGELKRVIAAGGNPRLCAFAGVGKTEAEIEFALRKGVYTFNVESEPELERINATAARLGKKAPVAVRVNPDVQAGTHKKITTGTYENKFGIAFEQVEAVYRRAARLRNIRLRGLQMHIGSQITEVKPFEQAVTKVLPLIERLKQRHGIEFFSLGGGLGIVYDPALASAEPSWWQKDGKHILTPEKYAKRLVPFLKATGLKILIEPGRFISGNAGVLITRIEYVKRTGSKNFLIVDAAMNDLIRPAFYEAYHEIVPLTRRAGPKIKSDVVGPICESGDFFCQNRELPKAAQGDYLCLMSAGAYSSAMGSNYNSRPFAAEILVDGRRHELVRKRQPIEDIWANERLASWLR